jgi:hypothetical protein
VAARNWYAGKADRRLRLVPAASVNSERAIERWPANSKLRWYVLGRQLSTCVCSQRRQCGGTRFVVGKLGTCLLRLQHPVTRVLRVIARSVPRGQMHTVRHRRHRVSSDSPFVSNDISVSYCLLPVPPTAGAQVHCQWLSVRFAFNRSLTTVVKSCLYDSRKRPRCHQLYD